MTIVHCNLTDCKFNDFFRDDDDYFGKCDRDEVWMDGESCDQYERSTYIIKGWGEE
jgi:hypothetical protein